MLPIRTSSIFRSRWMALLWAGGIIWSAVEFAGSQPGGNAPDNGVAADASGTDVDAVQMQQAEKFLRDFGGG